MTKNNVNIKLALKQLSKREFDILRCTCQGLSTTEIADKMQTSRHTINAHISSILNKLGVKDKTALLAAFIILSLNVSNPEDALKILNEQEELAK